MNTNQMPDSYSWKHEAGLADLHRDRIVEIAEKMIHEFDKDSGSGHRREELEWALQLFRSAYDDITSIHIRPFRDTQHSRANHLQHLLVPLMVGAFQLGGRSAIDNPAVADTIQFASLKAQDLQAKRAREGLQDKIKPKVDARRDAIISIAGGIDKLKTGRKFAQVVRATLESDKNFENLLSERGFSESQIVRAIKSIVDGRDGRVQP